ncbi:phage portal protein [Planobispora rosea]|uniref:phage portal protein n=1 Tax=Planobispora rosea TaxID=35762 RepID=UPI00083B776E|nr:phage portal protein [Planobispora rosea]
MSLIFGAPRPTERRSWATEPPIPPNSALGSSFARVDLSTAEASLQKVAVWASVALLAGTSSMLPIDVYTGTGPEKRERPKPRWMNDPAGDGNGLEDWIWQLMFSWLLRGNVYALVGERDSRLGTPTQIVLQHPDEVAVWRDAKDGKARYRILGQEVEQEQIWHRRVYPVPGRIKGMSPIAHHALTIGVGIAALRFGEQWFSEGAHPTGILSSDKNLDQTQATTAKDRFLAAIQGRREPVVLGQGWQYNAIQIAPGESQFLETNGFTSAECCRIFGAGLAEILGYETGSAMTYQNLEHRNLQLLIYALDPWLTRIERLFTELLPRPQYAKVNRNALLRTDLLTRYRAYQLMIRNRFGTPDEARELEDRPPLTPEQITQFTDIPPASGASTDTQE